MNVLSSDLTVGAGRGGRHNSTPGNQHSTNSSSQQQVPAGHTEPGSSLPELPWLLFYLDSPLRLFVFINNKIES